MRRGFKCKKDVLILLKREYEGIVELEYSGDYLKVIQHFDFIAEEKLRHLLNKFYTNHRSRDQAWKTCKGSLYEYAVFKCIQQDIIKNKLDGKLQVLMGEDTLIEHKDQIVIRNWSDIFPDVDMVIVEKETDLVKVIISCKTSLRERLTETAFWKRELERTKNTRDIKLIFITTDKDRELRIDTNRYILLHVIDCTFVTDPEKYRELIETYRRKYGNRKDFDYLLSRVKFIGEVGNFLKGLIKH